MNLIISLKAILIYNIIENQSLVLRLNQGLNVCMGGAVCSSDSPTGSL
jgi:hypothetical protein